MKFETIPDFNHYYYMRKRGNKTIPLMPHLFIYLKAPVEVSLRNIQKRGNPDEIKTVDETYLKIIEASYTDALKEFRLGILKIIICFFSKTCTLLPKEIADYALF